MELSGWIPRLPGESEHIEPRSAETILHLVKESRPYHSNGFTSRSHNNFVAEAQAGLEPVIVTEPGFPRDVVGESFEPLEVIDGIEHHRLDLGPHHTDLPVNQWLQDFAWLAADKVRDIRPAVIHVSSGRRGYETALVGLALQEKFDVPLVYEVRSFFEATWTSETGVDVESETYWLRCAVEEMCMRRADRILTLGHAMRDELISRGIDAEKIELVPNAVDLARFQPAAAADVAALRAEYGLTMPTFGYVSNMDHRREGQELLIEAAARMKENGQQAQCVLVGGGTRVEELKALAAERGVSDRVIFTGPVDHHSIAGHYALIDVFVVPRIRERAAIYVTPLKPFEAMAMMRPVVVSDLPALVEVVDPPHRGRAFAAEDVSSLVSTVTELLHDEQARAALADAGRAWVEASRQWKHNGERYRQAFAHATAHRRAATAENANSDQPQREQQP
nr:glycosyltransferase family 4 protein [Zhihengliuella flava]